ncbi:hydroxyproline O-arabinosyltransferase 3-like [Chenopodium quinoa]|uniref:hydroxyproline O-arabinosyltransferase 3-like n=1 Tax=Chenopodium quinoa TaxID=63459 RepID=UPI000B76DB4B|nr:hydroxyproline O-arabinosyltransferase 3-like [Chenopodium quinoa]
MNRRIRMGRGAMFLYVVLAFGFCIAICNFSTLLLIRSQPKVLSSYGPDRRVEPVINMAMDPDQGVGLNRLKFHVAVTATDSLYSKWQCRIMYYWYKRVKDLPGSDMGGFTRVLHLGHSDTLMEEIPSFVVDPLPEGVDQGYIVLNRPWAFVQWLEKAKIEEEYILMGEPDHLFVKPLPNLAQGKNPAAYPFIYFKPEENENIIRKFYPIGSILNVDPIGSSPVIIAKSLLKEIAPTWMNISLQIKRDPEADSTFDWVQEMYAYAIASALHGVKHNIHVNFMVQPPRDWNIGSSYIIHYTYGCDYNKKELTYGKITDWHFDKRSFQDGPPPKDLTLPPPGAPETVVRLMSMVNEATAKIPGWENL